MNDFTIAFLGGMLLGVVLSALLGAFFALVIPGACQDDN